MFRKDCPAKFIHLNRLMNPQTQARSLVVYIGALWRLLSYMPKYLRSCDVIDLVVLCLIGYCSQNVQFGDSIKPIKLSFTFVKSIQFKIL